MYNHSPHNEYYIPYITEDGKIALSVWDNYSEKDAKQFAKEHNACIFNKISQVPATTNSWKPAFAS